MARQKQADEWTDFLAESSLPSDDFTFTDGSNGGLDSFYFDLEMNEGVQDAARLPESKGLSGLPEGFVSEVEEGPEFEDVMEKDGFDLDSMLSEEEGGLPQEPLTEAEKTASSLVNLGWLDPTQKQDPKRLPHRPKSVTELENAWSVGNATDGIFLVPNKDRESAHQYDVPSGPASGLPGQAISVKTAVQRAGRRIHYGHSLREIAAELLPSVGMDTLKKVVAQLKAEQGLAGKVYVRASVFPGLKNGKWVKELKTIARTARYVLTDDPAVAERLGMEMVDEVPWAEALEFYTPRLVATGHRIASGDPKEALRRAFKAGPELAAPVVAPKPIHRPVEATEQQVKEALLQASLQEPVTVKTSDDQAVDKKLREALLKMVRWVKAGQLSQEDALRIYSSRVQPEAMLRVAAELITASKGSAVYAGTGADLPKDAQVARQRVWADLNEKQAALEAGLKKEFMVYLAKKVKAGALTQKEAKRIAAMPKPVKELRAITAAAIKAAAEARTIEVDLPEPKVYVGAVQKQALQQSKPIKPLDPFMTRVLKVAEEHEIKAGEITGLLKWARQQMSEGMAGTNLDMLLTGRFAKPLLKATSGLLREIRKEHEGLSGHVYVDASAYASNAGTTGCERGALKHRGNSIKHILAMPRCKGCVFANADGFCSQYNKRLANNPPIKNIKEFQTEAIRLANASDSESTAAMFNPGEFSLTSNMGVEIDREITPEKLGEVLFEGPILD